MIMRKRGNLMRRDGQRGDGIDWRGFGVGVGFGFVGFVVGRAILRGASFVLPVRVVIGCVILRTQDVADCSLCRPNNRRHFPITGAAFL